MRPLRLSLLGRWRLAVVLVAASTAAATFVVVVARPPVPPLLQGALAAVVAALVAVLAGDRLLRPARKALEALDLGLAALADGETNLHLAPSPGGELGHLVERFNHAAETLGDERVTARQREILLDTVIQAAPMALLLTDQRDRIVLANRSARETFSLPPRPEGRQLSAVLADGPGALVEVLAAGRDALFTVEQEGEVETYHLSRRDFDLAGRRHRLILVRRLTPELRRQEVTVWKRAIRTMSHEINNSLAPITSLARSAQRLLDEPTEHRRLGAALAVIGERADHLKDFLAGYARFARLPQPRPAEVPWRPFLDELAALSAFRLDGEPPARPGRFDRGKMQQVLLNLLANAREAGSPPEEVAVSVAETSDGAVVLAVADRGGGMGDEEMRSALVPFFSTKRAGAGLGLALCREIVEAHGGRLRLERRPGGGTTVVCWLPR
ncbi:MAG TPA: ATP-binding protein [Thermoanaerobaculia bacterium]|nr:ATP-binding protein [Thermoanaerobaculia bacterium]